MLFREFIAYNVEAASAQNVKELVVGYTADGKRRGICVFPFDMNRNNAEAFRNSAKSVTLTSIISQVRNKRWHICNPEVLADEFNGQ